MFIDPHDDARPGEAAATLLEALRRMGEAEAPATHAFEGLSKDSQGPAGAQGQLYAALRDGLAKWEREARRHAQWVDNLLNSRPAEAPGAGRTQKPAAPFQETLYLQGAAGTRTAGRFRALNRRDKRVSVATLSRPFVKGGEPALEAPSLTLRASAFYLEPGEARVVTVEAELPGPGRYECVVDLTMDEAVALKLWIEIDVYS